MFTDIIISHRNDYDNTKRCIESLRNHCDNFRIVVVDNSDTKYIYGDDVVVLKQPRPLNVTKAWNLGLLYAIANKKSDTICFIHNDLFVQNDLLSIGAPFLQMNGVFSPREDNDESKTYSEDLNALFCLGAHCFLARKSLFKLIGFFDERFFFAYQDSDYFERIRLLGMISVQLNQARAIHLKSSNSKKLYTDDEIHALSKSDASEYMKKYPWVSVSTPVPPSIPLKEFFAKGI